MALDSDAAVPTISSEVNASVTQGGSTAEQETETTPIIPVSPDAPSPDYKHPKYDAPSEKWEYRDAAPIEAARAYAARGWSVFPVHSLCDGICSCGKPKCGSDGKHPRTKNGHKDATRDEQQIHAWWTRYPDANIGVATGSVSGILVLDVDPRHGGDESLAKLIAEHSELPNTVEQVSGGGGWHFFFRYADGVKNSAGRLGAGLDVRGEGGYIIVAPSKTIGEYRWRKEYAPGEVELADAPQWLIDKLLEPENKAQFFGDNDFIRDGERNRTLASLAGTMRRRSMSGQAIEAALQTENHLRCRPPLSGAEVVRIAESICRYHAHSDFETTDLGNAERLAARHGHDLKYCKSLGKWLVWDGRRWRPDETEEVRLRTMETARAIYEEAALTKDTDRGKALASWAHRSQAKPKLDAMLSLAQPLLPVRHDELDRNHWVLNVENGTLNLKTGEFRTHDPDDLITKLAPVTFDPEAKCPIWDSFLDRVTDSRPRLSDYLKRRVGYSLTGDTSEDCMFIDHGTGRNGKTTFTEAISELQGDYACKAATKTFLDQKNEGVRNDLAALKGARFVTAAEVGDGGRLNEALIKEVTGGDTVTSRFLFREYFEYRPEFKLSLACNHIPEIRGRDEGIWSRVRVVPFDVLIPPAERDKQLPSKLRLELPGILNWALAGCLEWQQNGLQEPPEVLTATGAYRGDMDLLGPFFAEWCVTTGNEEVNSHKLAVPVAVFYGCYETWCRENGADVLGKTVVGKLMSGRGYKSKSLTWGGKRQRVYEGIALKPMQSE